MAKQQQQKSPQLESVPTPSFSEKEKEILQEVEKAKEQIKQDDPLEKMYRVKFINQKDPGVDLVNVPVKVGKRPLRNFTLRHNKEVELPLWAINHFNACGENVYAEVDKGDGETVTEIIGFNNRFVLQFLTPPA